MADEQSLRLLTPVLGQALATAGTASTVHKATSVEGTGGRNTVAEEAPGWRRVLAETSAISDFNTETAGGREP